MSPLYPDFIEVMLDPDSIEVVLERRDWRGRRSSERECIPVAKQPGAAAWRAAIGTLEAKLAALKPARRRARLVLADRFTCYTVMPWPTGHVTRTELRQIGAVELEAALGVDGSAHEIVLDIQHHGSNIVVCAISRDLLAYLRTCLNTYGVRAISICPRFVDTINRWRNRIERDAMVASIETERCVLGVLQDGQWRSVRSLRISNMAVEDLAASLRREQILQARGEYPLYVNLHGELDSSSLSALVDLQWLNGSAGQSRSSASEREVPHAQPAY